MKHDAFNTMPKADDTVFSENSRHNHDTRKLTCRNHTWRHCSSLSLMSKVLFTLNSFHEAKQSTMINMWEYWTTWSCE